MAEMIGEELWGGMSVGAVQDSMATYESGATQMDTKRYVQTAT